MNTRALAILPDALPSWRSSLGCAVLPRHVDEEDEGAQLTDIWQVDFIYFHRGVFSLNASVRASCGMRSLDKATLLVAAVLAATTLVLHISGPAHPVSLQQQAGTWSQHAARLPSQRHQQAASVLGQQAKMLEASAHSLAERAQEMVAAGRRAQQRAAGRASQAEEAVAIEQYLKESKSELDAYATNIEGLISAAAHSESGLARFPQQAAELHALLDHSLSEADATAVKIVRTQNGAPVRTGKAQDAHNVHRRSFATNIMSPEQTTLKHAEKKSDGVQNQVVKVMKKLRAVKAYAEGFKKGELAAGAHASLSSGFTHQLVQNSPLIGAVHVRHGELVDDTPRYSAKDLGLENEDPEVLKNATEVEPYDPAQDVVLACNSTCQQKILDSTIGLTFKVATKCIAECATGHYALSMRNGEPLPPWTTVDELKEQDTFCRGSKAYKQCKHDELDPVCDKLHEFMPSHCLIKQSESICTSCREVQGIECELGISPCEEDAEAP